MVVHICMFLLYATFFYYASSFSNFILARGKAEWNFNAFGQKQTIQAEKEGDEEEMVFLFGLRLKQKEGTCSAWAFFEEND